MSDPTASPAPPATAPVAASVASPVASPRDVARRVASRRAVLVGAAATVVLAGCATYDQRAPVSDPVDPGPGTGGAPPAGAAPTSAGAPAPGQTTGAAGGAPAGEALAATADIPVGGGTVFGDRRLVVTQPQAGVFKAFTAVCTHQGCTVAEVRNGTINCACHGSQFKIADGSVAKGPARAALAPVRLSVDGATLRLLP